MKIFVYDFETSGLPDFKNPSEGPQQPHIVECAALVYDADTGKLIEGYSAIGKPDGWEIPAELTAIHGISQEQALAEGVPEHEIVANFMRLHATANMRVAHNESFDARIARIAIKRFGDGRADYSAMSQEEKDAIADAFKPMPAFCTCNTAKGIMKLPATEAMRKSGRGSWFKAPNLAEAYQHFTGEPLQDAHRATSDARACARIYFALNPIKASAEEPALA
jgi:DNA polymerase-3 subunit epsilon